MNQTTSAPTGATQSRIRERVAAIQLRILDAAGDIVEGIARREAEHAQTEAQLQAQRRRIEAALRSEIAALTCDRAACRRARRCRGAAPGCIARRVDAAPP